MSRMLIAGGATMAMIGVGLIIPALITWLEHEAFSNVGCVILSLGGVLILAGLASILRGVSEWSGVTMPAPVRAMVTANTLLLAFCALETSDGLLRQEGRIFYWTTVLFAPLLLLHGGLILARRWAWWAARGLTAFAVLWFVGFIIVIPFADLRTNDGPTPFWGRMYMVGVTLVFASMSAFAFHALGSRAARDFFGTPPIQPENVSPKIESVE